MKINPIINTKNPSMQINQNRLMLSCFLLMTITSCFSQLSGARIQKEEFTMIKADQPTNEWCFAASVQMVLNFYGVSIGQKEIAQHIFGLDANGNIKKKDISQKEIQQALNGWVIESKGRKYKISSAYYSGFNQTTATSALQNRHPVILTGYNGTPNGHAMLLTELGFAEVQDKAIYKSTLKKIFEIDPYPGNFSTVNGLEFLNEKALDFVNNVENTWVVNSKYLD